MKLLILSFYTAQKQNIKLKSNSIKHMVNTKKQTWNIEINKGKQ